MVLEVIAEETSIDEFDLRDAVWRLIGRGLITLTRDRKLSTVIAE